MKDVLHFFLNITSKIVGKFFYCIVNFVSSVVDRDKVWTFCEYHRVLNEVALLKKGNLIPFFTLLIYKVSLYKTYSQKFTERAFQKIPFVQINT